MLERRARRGKRVQALEDRTEVYEDLLPVWDGFCTLHAARGSSFGAEPLRVCDILGWIGLFHISQDTRCEYFELIRLLDDVWLEHIRKEQKEKADADTASRNRRKRSR